MALYPALELLCIGQAAVVSLQQNAHDGVGNRAAERVLQLSGMRHEAAGRELAGNNGLQALPVNLAAELAEQLPIAAQDARAGRVRIGGPSGQQDLQNLVENLGPLVV